MTNQQMFNQIADWREKGLITDDDIGNIRYNKFDLRVAISSLKKVMHSKSLTIDKKYCKI